MSKGRTRRPKPKAPAQAAAAQAAPTAANSAKVTGIGDRPGAGGSAAPAYVERPRLAVTTDVNSLPQHEVDERALAGLMEDWRKGRASKNLWQALSDAYVAVFTSIMVVAMLVSSLLRAQALAADCTTSSCTTGRGLLPWAAMFGVLAFVLALARMFGPVLASAAEGFWLMEAPLSRRRLLARRLVSAIVLAFVGGALTGALVSAVTGSPAIAVLAWTLACGLGAAGLTALAAAEQGAERTWLVGVVQVLLALAALGALVLVVATAAGWVAPVLGRSTTEHLAFVVAGVGIVLLVASAAVAHQRLDRMRRARLVEGGSLVSGMQGAAYALDFALMRDILVTREANRRGHVRPTRGRSSGLRALVMRDAQRLVRFPKPLFTLLASAVVPYAVQALGLGRLTVPISAIVLVGALIPFFSSLRVLSRSKGLARSLPFTTGEIRSAASVVPAILAMVWAMLVTPAFLGVAEAPILGRTPAGAAMHAMVTGVAGFIGAIRWVSARPANYQAPMMSTEMGAMPPGLMFNLVRGFDMVALISLPVLFGGSPWISLAIALVCFMILRTGGLDQEELAAMQEENKRVLAEARAGSGKGGSGKGSSLDRSKAATGPKPRTGATKATAPEKIKVKRPRT